MSEQPKENLIQEAQGPHETTQKQGLEVAVSSSPDSLQEKLGVLGDAIAHDHPITDANLAELSSVAEEMKLNIGGKELTLKDAENIGMVNNFLKEKSTSGWGVKEEDLPTFKVEFIDPKELDYKNKADNPDKTKFGQYSLNPETFGMDFEKSKVFIPDLSVMNGKKLPEVFKYVVDTYEEKYYIPGIEYWKWMIENPDKAEEVAKRQNYDIKDVNYYYFLGSIFCSPSYGRWGVPGSNWDGRKFSQGSKWLERKWDSVDRVILLEK